MRLLAKSLLKTHSLADWLITHLAVARASANRALAEEVTQPIRDILGRVPLTSKQFVQDHKAAFA